MRVVFAGTPEFAQIALARLHEAGFDIPLVLTQPDRPAGRGMKLQASAVKQFALAHGMAVAQPRSLRLDGKYPQDAASARQALLATRADVMVVAAYGLILPPWTLELPRLGCLNIHASLLPRWRGAAPIHRAIEAGDAQTGVTLMQMDAGLDTGDMLQAQSLPIADEETTGTLHDKLAELGGRMIVQALQAARHAPLARTPQPAQGVCYAHKIEKSEAQIDWCLPAATLARKVRAFQPSPGACSTVNGDMVKLWRCEVVAGAGEPGRILAVGDAGITVACGAQALRLQELQRAGGKRLDAAQFLRGFALQAGQRFETQEEPTR
jgi:methionyl-tRNA formyltransferase